MPLMPGFAKGVIRFQQEVFPRKRALFRELTLGQSPEALFITCSDSRIETAMITQTDPGQLFICRNAGNIVPPHLERGGGMTASIEYAVAALRVPHVVICGHTGCGAMDGAMHMERVESLPHVREWLGYAREAVDAVRRDGAQLDDGERMLMLIERNVILQLEHLRTHPSVSTRLAAGDLQLHGWVYDIGAGRVTAYDEVTQRFVPVAQRYSDERAAP
jgi:carbonic anhydrase